MTSKIKRKNLNAVETPAKKQKKDKEEKTNVQKNIKKSKKENETDTKAVENVKNDKSSKQNGQTKVKMFEKATNSKPKGIKSKGVVKFQGKGAVEKNKDFSWNEFKKKKKDLREKRKASNKIYDVVVEANHISEKLRRKTLEGGQDEKKRLIEKLHSMLMENNNYENFALKHDTSRVIQYLLKFGNEVTRNEISKKLLSHAVEMIQSKYGRYCVKRMLKYGNSETRAEIIKSFYGHAVKLTSHGISAPVFEYAYTTFASQLHKRHFVQEFFGDMFKQTKDDHVHHLRDVYANSPDMKAAALGATKANLLKILNKSLLDSGLVHTVLYQFLSECSSEDKAELISQLANRVVFLSNSKDGTKAVMQCMWNGTHKDRKTIVKCIKEFIIDLSKHEHGHATVIGLLDTADDTVLIHKAILTPLLEHAFEIASTDWGRKVILWLVAPAESAHFHPVFIKELEDGRANSTCKKDPQTRRKELLNYSIENLLQQVASSPKDWMSTAALAIVTVAILKAGSGQQLVNAYDSIVEALLDINWKVKEEEEFYLPVEHPGLHMALKKLAQHDKVLMGRKDATFGERVVSKLNEEVVKEWIKTNRGCFFLVLIFENGTEDTQMKLKALLKPIINLIDTESSKGSKVLLKKLKSWE